jgi:hypothetical protein
MVFETQAEARAAGQNLRRRMLTKGWKIRVWESLGWHMTLLNGPIVLRMQESSRGLYYAWVSEDELGRSTRPEWAPGQNDHFFGTFEDPNDAVDFIVGFVERAIQRQVSVLQRAQKIVQGAGAKARRKKER